MKIYAKCPDGVKVDYLTAGKLYEVLSEEDEGLGFTMVDDDGDVNDPRYCSWKKSFHINGLDWTRIEIPDDVEAPQMLIEVKTRADVLAAEATIEAQAREIAIGKANFEAVSGLNSDLLSQIEALRAERDQGRAEVERWKSRYDQASKQRDKIDDELTETQARLAEAVGVVILSAIDSN